MKYKAIFSDFDGTLYRDDYTISDTNKKAIHDYVNHGGKFILATGRLFQSIRPIAQNDLDLHRDIIVYQGAGVYDIDSGELKHSDYISKDKALEIARFLDQQEDVIGVTYLDDNCYCKADNDFIKKFASICKIKYNVTGKSLYEFINENPHDPMKFIALVNENKADDLVASAKKEFGEEMSMCKSKPFIVEFLPTGTNKASAIAKLCKDYGLKREEIIAVGDSENDMSMIEYAGLGIATGNAFKQTKDKADFVSKTNDEDAIAQIIYKFCLNDIGE